MAVLTSLCPSHWVEYQTLVLEGNTHMCATPSPFTSRVKICKAPQSSQQFLQRKIGQMSELKCIPGDMSSSFSLWPSSSHLPYRSCLSLHFSSNCISWPDAGPSDDNMDPHLPLFRIGELKTLNAEILSSYGKSWLPDKPPDRVLV